MSVVDVRIKSNGKAVDPALSLLSVDIRRELNRLPTAQLVFVDGDMPVGDFPISSSTVFDVGAEIEIEAGYLGEQSSHASLFKGVVVRHAIEAGSGGSASAMLRIELRDKAIRLAQGRRTALYEQMSDSDVFKRLVGDAGLKLGQIDATSFKHPALVQYQCSDWDFLLVRAEAQGRVITVVDGMVSLVTPKAAAEADHMASYGGDIYAFDIEVDGMASAAGAKASSWDSKNQAVVTGQGSNPPALAVGRSHSDKLAKGLNRAALQLGSPAPLAQDELTTWATATLMRAELASVRGTVRLMGLPKAALLRGVELSSIAKRFNGKAPVTALAHRIAEGQWTTDLQLGLAARPHHLADGLAQPPASGLNPPLAGLCLAVVSQVHQDPDKAWRVKVQLAGLPDPAVAVWARLALPQAGKDRGWYLRPEVGDEVVLGCLHDDPRQPVVLGCLHSAKNPPPASLTDDTADDALSGFFTRSGLSLVLDDKKKSLLIKTPAGHQVLLDDDAKSLGLKDSHGNEITLDKDGVRIKSVKDLAFEASGNVTVKGSKIDLQ